jgi:hypothetical protein
MFVLLSSGAQKRYRDDILRCMAAPVGSIIQFRYNREIVGKSILQKPDAVHGKQGIVCNLDLESHIDGTNQWGHTYSPRVDRARLVHGHDDSCHISRRCLRVCGKYRQISRRFLLKPSSAKKCSKGSPKWRPVVLRIGQFS